MVVLSAGNLSFEPSFWKRAHAEIRMNVSLSAVDRQFMKVGKPVAQMFGSHPFLVKAMLKCDQIEEIDA